MSSTRVRLSDNLFTTSCLLLSVSLLLIPQASTNAADLNANVQVSTAVTFKDVSAVTPYADAITYVKNKNIVQGFGDQSFRPDNTVTRAELLKMVFLANNTNIEAQTDTQCFSDVDKNMWYAKYICYAQGNQIINGFPDGSFKPNAPVSYQEALKISMNTLGLRPEQVTNPWYKAYEDKASKQLFTVPNVSDDNKFARGEMAELLARQIKKANNESPFALTAPQIITPTSDEILRNYPREAKLSWTAVSGADYYEIELACDVCVSTTTMWLSPNNYKTTQTSFVTPPLAGDNQFRVRVRAVASSQYSDWSAYRYFRYVTPAVAPTAPNVQTLAAPTILAPNPDQTLATYPRRTNISWTPVTGAYKYEMELACDTCVSVSTLWLGASSTTVTETSLQTQPLAGDNQFRVRVRALASNGLASEWSTYRYFRYDTSAYVVATK
ncbi:S-layer homology domain-containing protein [Candidatus Gracilibacteria bacterium]|nr:S-layer homology domain-containing protein [Candidatus Gracilibacteria bacterium]